MSAVRNYIISLDVEPEKRWKPVIDDFRDEIKNVYEKLEKENGGLLSSIASGLITTASCFGYVLHDKELNYIAQECDIPFGKLVILQIMYELSACCTSTVFCVDGVPVHFRTMDWPLLDLKRLTITVEFQKQGKTIFRAVTWAGYVGAMTAIKKDVCSISLNYRSTQGSLLENIQNLYKSYWPAGYLIRHLMESDLTCQQVINSLSQSTLVAPCYFIICGTKKDNCAIIVRDRDAYESHPMINDQLIQTNIDPNAGRMCPDILYSRQRKALAIQIIDKIQNNKNDHGDIFEKFAVHPIINEETVYMCVMIPSMDYLSVRVV